MNGKLKPFQRGFLPDLNYKSFKEKFPNLSEYEINFHLQKLKKDEVWINDEYQVNIDKSVMAFNDTMRVWHLSIKRLDKEPIHDWRDLQAIKNMLVGEEYEAIELYPSEKRVVDSANQYHLWAFIQHIHDENKVPQFPIGWTRGNKRDEEDAISGAKQRKL